jgi:hypothetical protein
MSPLPLDRHAHVALLVRSRALRLRACEALERATQLRRRAEHVLSTVRATVFPTLAEQSSPASAAGGTEPPDEASGTATRSGGCWRRAGAAPSWPTSA